MKHCIAECSRHFHSIVKITIPSPTSKYNQPRFTPVYNLQIHRFLDRDSTQDHDGTSSMVGYPYPNSNVENHLGFRVNIFYDQRTKPFSTVLCSIFEASQQTLNERFCGVEGGNFLVSMQRKLTHSIHTIKLILFSYEPG